jgi:hypothetical protein
LEENLSKTLEKTCPKHLKKLVRNCSGLNGASRNVHQEGVHLADLGLVDALRDEGAHERVLAVAYSTEPLRQVELGSNLQNSIFSAEIFRDKF